MKKEKGIDDIFKQSLQDPVNEPDFDEHDWDAFENMLDSKTGTGTKVLWMRYLSAAAAIVIITFCWWMFKPAENNAEQNIVKTKTESRSKIIDSARKQQPQIALQAKNNKQEHLKSDESNVIPKTSGAVANKPNNAVSNYNKAQPDKFIASGGGLTGETGIAAPPDVPINSNANNIIAAQPSINLINPLDASVVQLNPANALANAGFRPFATIKAPAVKKTSSSSLRPQFALTVLASPELNGIGSLKSGSRGNNVGLMFTVGVKKFTLSTGANYTVKPYSLPYSQYPSSYSYKNTPETVTADCRMLDIPINLGYQVLNKSGNKLTLGTGLSSYIMTHETYTYDYAAGAKVYGPSYYAVQGHGKYLFSIMNLQATYERKVNSKFGLSVQPYFKLPLSEIGYSRVRVQTFGVALGVNWNINSLTKPK